MKRPPEEDTDTPKAETAEVQENTPAPRTMAAPRSEQQTARNTSRAELGSAAGRKPSSNGPVLFWRDWRRTSAIRPAPGREASRAS